MTTILEEPIGELSGYEYKYISVLYSQLYNHLFIISISNCSKKMPL